MDVETQKVQLGPKISFLLEFYSWHLEQIITNGHGIFCHVHFDAAWRYLCDLKYLGRNESVGRTKFSF